MSAAMSTPRAGSKSGAPPPDGGLRGEIPVRSNRRPVAVSKPLRVWKRGMLPFLQMPVLPQHVGSGHSRMAAQIHLMAA